MSELISTKVPSTIQDFPLDRDSLVFIVGAWCGDAAKYYADKYGCHVYCFEPQPAQKKYLEDKFKGYEKVKIFDFGLGTATGSYRLSRVGTDRCSFIERQPGKDGKESTFEGPYEIAKLVNIKSFLSNNNIDRVDVTRINCEGYEFKLLTHMIISEVIGRFKYLMVQFHLHHEGAELMDAIWEGMKKTHDIRDNYFPAWVVWEAKE